MTEYLKTLSLRPFADKDGTIKIEARVGDPFVLYDAVLVLVPRKQFDNEDGPQKELREAIEALGDGLPDFPDPREPRCTHCKGTGYEPMELHNG